MVKAGLSPKIQLEMEGRLGKSKKLSVKTAKNTVFVVGWDVLASR